MFWPRTNYRRDVSSGVVLFVWCWSLSWWMVYLAFELVFMFMFWAGVYYIIISYIIHIHYILYYILYYTLLLFFSFPPNHLLLIPLLPVQSFLSSNQYLSVLTYTYLYNLQIYSSNTLFFSSIPLLFPSSQYSFYTCRYLHILIYIQSVLFSYSSLPISPLILSHLPPSSHLLPNIHSILVGTYIYLFIFFPK